ncbi:MAG: hypothetical protein IPK60_22900 [Sandaracinaceae bacterium]|nr:hypothetical protein [Sandaracinaceae bacterium]
MTIESDNVLDEIKSELARSIRKHPISSWPDGTTGAPCSLRDVDDTRMSLVLRQEILRFLEKESLATWLSVLLCEVHEAASETDPARLRAELIQVANVCVRWVLDIDSRAR